MPDAASNGANQRRTKIHFANANAACTTNEGVPAWMPDSAGMLCWPTPRELPGLIWNPMADHQRDAASNDDNSRAYVQQGDKPVVVTSDRFRVNVQRMAPVEHYQRQENHGDPTPEYPAPSNTPPPSHI